MERTARLRDRVIPVNLMEAMIEPFWDPSISGFTEWRVEREEGCGAAIEQRWSYVYFEWKARPASADRPVLQLTRSRVVDCTGYDTLVFSYMAAPGSVMKLVVDTDIGELTLQDPPFGTVKRESALSLNGAAHIRKFSIELFASDKARGGAGWFNWIGLQQTNLLPRYESIWNRYDAAWDGYLQPETYRPSYAPAYGIVANAEEIRRLRERHDALLAAGEASPFEALAAEAGKLAPERMIGEFVNFWNDTRYSRERDRGKHLLTHGVNAAVAGVLLRDPKLLRLAVRYAMSLAHCGRWDGTFQSGVPGSAWEHRSFVQSLCVYEAAFILDLAGEWFTDLGREVLLRRIAEEGIGNINYMTWKHEYIHHCNQLVWFSPGRLLACLVLERTMPRVKPYTELALAELSESVERTVLPDGGYDEGPTYFTWTVRQTCLSLYYYARARGLSFDTLLPDRLRNSAAYIELLASTDERTAAIMLGDAANVNVEAAAFLAQALPRSAWASVYRKLTKLSGIPDTLHSLLLDDRIPAQGPPPAPFRTMPETGLMCSVRQWKGETVKWLIVGNRAGAGHNHEDKGSFVFEFAGDTYAADFGTCDYSHPIAEELVHCQRHNMLVPLGIAERPCPENPISVNLRPEGFGDQAKFEAELNVSAGWERYYKRWIRTWRSDAPNRMTIIDDYELLRGSGVAFLWTTRLPVSVNGSEIVVEGSRSRVRLTVPPDCRIEVDRLPLMGETDAAGSERHGAYVGGIAPGQDQQVIRIVRDAPRARLEVKAELFAAE